jgi:flavin reductase
MTIESPTFRDAMARLGAAVSVITTDGPGGLAGMTASAVCGVTDAPPTLLVCINRESASCEVFEKNGVLCVNALASGQREISDRFAGRTGLASADRFDGTDWQRLATGAPLISGALVSFDCRIADRVDRGTHAVFFAEVEAVTHQDTANCGLIYFARSYHVVGKRRSCAISMSTA